MDPFNVNALVVEFNGSLTAYSSKAVLDNEQPCHVVIYDRTPTAIFNIASALYQGKSFLILDHTWPERLQQSLTDIAMTHAHKLEAPTVLIPTSGSTGHPKLCCHSRQSIIASASRSLEHQPMSNDHGILLTLSPAHMGGLLAITKALISGARLLLSDDWLSALSSPSIHLIMVPQQINKLTNHLDHNPQLVDNILSVLVGGDHASPALRSQVSNLKLPVIYSYGLTETCGQITATTVHDGSDHSGLPFSDTQIQLLNGAISLKTPTLAIGYLTPIGMSPIPLNDGWFVTSDLGQLNSDGTLVVLGRSDDQFNSGSELISPQYVESVLLMAMNVSSIIIVPKDDAKFGAIPVACISSDANLADLRQYSANHLPLFMRPKHWVVIPDTIQLESKSLRQLCRDYVDGLNL